MDFITVWICAYGATVLIGLLVMVLFGYETPQKYYVRNVVCWLFIVGLLYFNYNLNMIVTLLGLCFIGLYSINSIRPDYNKVVKLYIATLLAFDLVSVNHWW